MNRLAIDPGGVHVGYAYGENEWVAGEWTPEECVENVVVMMTRNEVDELIVEEFVLYEWEAKKHAWDQFETVQLIGMLKLIARWFRIPVVIQSATIKKPTRRQMAARNVKHVGPSIHARDAELHLFYRVRRRQEECRQSSQSGSTGK